MPSAEQLALWAAIRMNPDDDTPRLVYADWLQENGDEPRAEFIRLQCELAKPPEDRHARKLRPGMVHRERVLLTANRVRWVEPVVRLIGRTRRDEEHARYLGLAGFRRGFLSGLQLDIDGSYRLATASPPLEPIEDVSIFSAGRAVGDSGKIEAIADWPDAGCFRAVSWQHANDEDVWVVAGAGSRLARVTAVSFWDGSVTDAGAALLAGWPGATRLETLGLHTNRITDTGAAALADSPHLAGLRRLDLRRNPITDAGERRLVARFGAAVLLPDD